MYEIDSKDQQGQHQRACQSSRPLEKGARVSEKTFFGPGLKISGEGGSVPQAPPLNPPLQQQVYSDQYYHFYTWCYRLKYK